MASNNFRIEPIEGTRLVKIYSENNQNLPIEFDCSKRFATLSAFAEEYLEIFQDFEVRKDDIWVITPPKSGTTWMLELVWLLQNDCDFETALKIDQEVRIPFLELCTLLQNQQPNSIDVAAKMSSPRIIKSHLPIHLLPKRLWTVKPKIIFVTRNPQDAIVSFYHHHCAWGVFKGTKEEYVNLMLENKIRFAPFGIQTLEFWQLRNESYVFFTSFERMKKDLRSVILAVGKFLQKNIDDEKQMAKLLDHLSFEKMKANPKCNHMTNLKMYQNYYGAKTTQFEFIRKGEINSHKAELNKEIIELLDKWHTTQLDDYGVTAEEIYFS